MFQKAFRGGSFRGTIRGAKHRPELLPSGNGDSPFVAGDAGQVKLTGIRHKKPKITGVSGAAAKKGTHQRALTSSMNFVNVYVPFLINVRYRNYGYFSTSVNSTILTCARELQIGLT